MTQILDCLQLCNGSNLDEVDKLHQWLGDEPWEGGEDGIYLTNQICLLCGDKGACVKPGDWMTKLPNGVIIVTPTKPEQIHVTHH